MKQDLKSVIKLAATIESSTTLQEGEWLYLTAKNLKVKPKTVVEIGSFLGKSTIFLGSGINRFAGARVYAIDPHRGDAVINHQFSGPTYKKFLANITRSRLGKIVVPISLFSS